jgi:uncharacterized membrane protein YdjX (TVP38/TMEM64 family)
MSTGILKNNSTSLLVLFVTLVLPLSVSSFSLVFLSQYEELFNSFNALQWSIFYLATALTMSLALTPTTYIALVSGYFIGWIGLLGLIPSYLLASLIGFYIAKKLDKGKIITYLNENKKIEGIIKNLKTEELWVIFFCRISPFLPFAMMNIFLSYIKAGLKNFLIGSVLGMLPRTILMVWLGTQANDIIKMLRREGEPDLSNILIVLLLIFSIVGLYVLFMRAIKKNAPEN